MSWSSGRRARPEHRAALRAGRAVGDRARPVPRPGRRRQAARPGCSSRSRPTSCAPGWPGGASSWPWASRTGPPRPLEVERSGSFLLARTPAHAGYLRRELAQSAGWGVDVQPVSPAQLGGQVSYCTPAGEGYALWCPEDVYIEEPISLIRAYAAACARHGAEVAENEPVIGIEVTGGQVRAVQTERRRITAGAVVDAAGAWVAQVASLAGGEVPVAPVRHQLLITEPDPGVGARRSDRAGGGRGGVPAAGPGRADGRRVRDRRAAGGPATAAGLVQHRRRAAGRGCSAAAHRSGGGRGAGGFGGAGGGAPWRAVHDEPGRAVRARARFPGWTGCG